MTAIDVLRSFVGPGRAPAPVPWLAAPEQRSLAEPEDWLVDALGGTATRSGERVTIEGALGIDAVFACIQLIAGQGGSLPCSVYVGSGRQRRVAVEDPRFYLLHEEPNPETAPDQFFEALLAGVLAWGNGYVEKVKNRAGGVAELWNVSPKGIRVERTSSGEKRFHVPGVNRTLGSDVILHVPGLGFDGVRGLSVIEQCRETLGTIRARDGYEGRLYANDATPGGVLSVDGELSEDAARRLKEGWEEAHRGGENRHRVAVLEGGTKWQSIGLPLKDQEFIERSRFTVAQVARMFGVAPELVGGDRSGSLTYSTVEGQAIQFATFTLRRWLVRVERSLRRDRDLFPDPRAAVPKFSIDALMRGDSAARAAFYRTMREIGAMSVNDVREKEDLPDIGPEGDVYQTTIAGAAPASEPAAQDPAPALDAARRRLEALASVPGHAGAGLNGNREGV